MSDIVKTLVYVGAAVVLFLAALFSVPGTSEPAFFNDEGQALFADFTDPTTAAALEVVAFDADTASYAPFRVERKDGRWSIPSHHFYPADAEDEMSKAAALLIGLKKDRVVSDDPADHVLYGVVDPKSESIDTEGRGTLVTFQDGGGNPLASLIVGNAVEGKSDQRYVRYPDKKRTYVTKLAKVPSTRFGDWIETDLLDTSAYDITELVFDNYSMREIPGMGRIERIDGDIVQAVKKDNQWQLEGLAPNEETNKTAVGAVGTELAGLKIVGVRPKPEGLSRALTGDGGLTQEARLSLQNRGFYLAQDGQLWSNEGDLIAKTRKGVVYTLRFGEVLFGTGDSLTAGDEDEAATPGAEQPADDSVKANRYLMVTASFDDSVLDKPAQEGLPLEEMDRRKDARLEMVKILGAVERWRDSHDGTLPTALAVLTEGEVPELTTLEQDPWGNDYVFQVEGEDFWLVCYAADGAEGGEGINQDLTSKEDWAAEDALVKAAEEWEEYQRKVKEGTDEADRLSRRFAPWYYVVSDESFRKLRPTRDTMITIVEPEPGEDDADMGTNGDGAPLEVPIPEPADGGDGVVAPTDAAGPPVGDADGDATAADHAHDDGVAHDHGAMPDDAAGDPAAKPGSESDGPGVDASGDGG